MVEFVGFPKIPRLLRECVISEKLDGTNASIHIREYDSLSYAPSTETVVTLPQGEFLLRAGSRTRWITPTQDNFGFAKWVWDNATELVKLGIGHHFGEWWGKGIQRTYNMDTRKFSLFNTSRWQAAYDAMNQGNENEFPNCVSVVPELYRGIFSTVVVNEQMNKLKLNGSTAAKGFMSPEGVVVYHSASKQVYKRTFEGDERGKEGFIL